MPLSLTVLLLLFTLPPPARAGHELPFYPGYYPQEIRLEFMVRHNQVICPQPGGLNPYHVGFMVWRDIEKRFGGEHSAEGCRKLFEVRETERDVSFLRRFLT